MAPTDPAESLAWPPRGGIYFQSGPRWHAAAAVFVQRSTGGRYPRRSGASTGATVSFLIATPENGIDSISLSYVLLGPLMTIVRPISAILIAISTGLLTEYATREANSPPTAVAPQPSCCGTNSCCAQTAHHPTSLGPWGRLRDGVIYGLTDLFADMAGWLLIGILAAAAVATFVPSDMMMRWGSGLPAMLAMAAISVPMYICATASTPIAAALLLAGISPGTVLVFLLAGPATNVATLGVVKREMGWRVLVVYLAGVCGGAVGLGLAADVVVTRAHINIVAQAAQAAEFFPQWLSVGAAVLLAILALVPLRRALGQRMGKLRGATQARRTALPVSGKP